MPGGATVSPAAAFTTWAGTTARRRVHEPNTWSVCLLLLLAVVLLWHQALVRFIYGRPHHFLQFAQTNTTTSSPAVVPAFPALPTHHLRPLPTHAPVDPFRPLVAGDGSISRPATIHLPGVAAHPHTRPADRPATGHRPGAAADGCRATYVVRSGDSLWSIASATMHTPDWHALYAANRSAIGDDPSYVTIGEHLCVPPR